MLQIFFIYGDIVSITIGSVDLFSVRILLPWSLIYPSLFTICGDIEENSQGISAKPWWTKTFSGSYHPERLHNTLNLLDY